MKNTFDYDSAVRRNAGYIDATTQQRIREARLLVAGCGIGSSLAICAARLGFENFVLVDGDVVEAHNLNRQFYEFGDIGQPKVTALRDKILSINPEARIEIFNEYLGNSNTSEIVSRADVVFDTVDFLDLPAILLLHRCAREQGKDLFTALSVGFGALVWFFPAKGEITLADLLKDDIENSADQAGKATYADVFGSFIRRISNHLDEEVVLQIRDVLTKMKEGKPCPASQVSPGSFAVGALAGSMLRDLFMGRHLPVAPEFVVHSLSNHIASTVRVE
jgi:molybdopterin/thiamine biosynthesis adenylyltransferase